MHIMIRYPNGRTINAVLLAAHGERMRIMADSGNDALELMRVDECWYTELGVNIEIEALIPIPGMDISRICADVRPRACAASVAS